MWNSLSMRAGRHVTNFNYLQVLLDNIIDSTGVELAIAMTGLTQDGGIVMLDTYEASSYSVESRK